MLAESRRRKRCYHRLRATPAFDIITGLEAKVSDRLTTRLSYDVEYDSNPPAGAVETDTLSRFTLVYGF